MSTSVKFNTITLADVKQLMTIETACHSHPWSEKTFRTCIGNRYFGEKLTQDKDILGFYIGEHVIDEATLMDICVTPSFQGEGYGKQLLNQFIQHAKDKGTTKIWLEVRAKNISAQMLYMNAGFVEISRRTGYYPSSSGFGYEDAIVMQLKL